jgi:ketosteroid isomerase-like protein
MGFISCLIFLASICTSAQESDSAVKSKVIALEKLWNQAYKSGDTKALDSILDEGIVLVNDDGSMQTKTEFLASVKSAPATVQQQQVSPESFNVHVYGNVAIATGIMRVKGEEGASPITAASGSSIHGYTSAETGSASGPTSLLSCTSRNLDLSRNSAN